MRSDSTSLLFFFWRTSMNRIPTRIEESGRVGKLELSQHDVVQQSGKNFAALVF